MHYTEENQVEREKDALYNAWENLREMYTGNESTIEGLQRSIYAVSYRLIQLLCTVDDPLLPNFELANNCADLYYFYEFLESVKTSLRE